VYKKGGDMVDAGDPIMRLDLQATETEYNKLLDEEQMKQLQLEQLRLSTQSNLSEMKMKLKVSRMELDRKAVELRNEQYLDSLGAGTTDKVREVELAYNVGLLQLDEDQQKYVNAKALSDADIKVKELELNIFRKGLAESRRTLEDARICSPKKAVLTYVNNEVGVQVTKGSRIAVISDLSRFKVEGEIADSYADRIAPGSRAVVSIGNDRFEGFVSDVIPLSRNGVISFTVQLEDAGNDRLRSGLKTDIYVMYAVNDDVMRIANASYYAGRGQYSFFVVDGDDRLVRRKVTLGDANYDYVKVISGLDVGDKVVISDMQSYDSRDELHLK
jgi:HlyD family secretion protein